MRRRPLGDLADGQVCSRGRGVGAEFHPGNDGHAVQSIGALHGSCDGASNRHPGGVVASSLGGRCRRVWSTYPCPAVRNRTLPFALRALGPVRTRIGHSVSDEARESTRRSTHHIRHLPASDGTLMATRSNTITERLAVRCRPSLPSLPLSSGGEVVLLAASSLITQLDHWAPGRSCD